MATNNSAQQMEKKNPCESETKNSSNQAELPLETSPYLSYDSVEDYKRKGYGTDGHKEPVERKNAAGSTDAPTLSGADVPPSKTAPTFPNA